MAELRYREALNAALREELARDERVMLMGEDIGVFGGAFKVTAGLLEEFGERRVRDTPISENTIVGMGVGAAMVGLRPVVELMTINFALLAFDQIVNHAAHIHYMFGGQARVPLVVRMPQGAGHQLGPHALALPGGLLHARARPARRHPLHSRRRQGSAEGRDPRREPRDLHRARVALRPARARCPTATTTCRTSASAAVRREGADVTIVGISRMAITAERAAQTLADEHGVQAEVIDPRTLRPLDLDTVLRSVAKTNRCVVVEEGWPHGGVGANLAALIAEQAFDDLDAPVRRVTGADVPMPYSKPLEEIAFPHEPQVVHAALEVLGQVPVEARDERDRDAPPLRHDGGGHHAALAQARRRARAPRRGARRDRDRQGRDGLRVRPGGRSCGSSPSEGDTLAVGATIAHVGEAGAAGAPSAESAGARPMRPRGSGGRSRRRHGRYTAERSPPAATQAEDTAVSKASA